MKKLKVLIGIGIIILHILLLMYVSNNLLADNRIEQYKRLEKEYNIETNMSKKQLNSEQDILDHNKGQILLYRQGMHFLKQKVDPKVYYIDYDSSLGKQIRKIRKGIKPLTLIEPIFKGNHIQYRIRNDVSIKQDLNKEEIYSKRKYEVKNEFLYQIHKLVLGFIFLLVGNLYYYFEFQTNSIQRSHAVYFIIFIINILLEVLLFINIIAMGLEYSGY